MVVSSTGAPARSRYHNALSQAATTLCRRLSIPRLLFRDFSPKTREFYLVRLVGWQVPRHQGQTESLVITDSEGRTYRDLNRVLEMDFWLLTRWRIKHAPRMEVVITPA
jgi:hypothetical protein